MTPTGKEVVDLLERLHAECMAHNHDYHHRTPSELLVEITQMIKRIEEP